MPLPIPRLHPDNPSPSNRLVTPPKIWAPPPPPTPCIKSPSPPFLFKKPRSPCHTHKNSSLPTLTLLLLSTLPARAQLQPPTPTSRLRRTHLLHSPNHRCFTLTDRTGAESPSTSTAKPIHLRPRPRLPPRRPPRSATASPPTSTSTPYVDVTNRQPTSQPPLHHRTQTTPRPLRRRLPRHRPSPHKSTTLQQTVDGQVAGTDSRNARDALRPLPQNPFTPTPTSPPTSPPSAPPAPPPSTNLTRPTKTSHLPPALRRKPSSSNKASSAQ